MLKRKPQTIIPWSPSAHHMRFCRPLPQPQAGIHKPCQPVPHRDQTHVSRTTTRITHNIYMNYAPAFPPLPPLLSYWLLAFSSHYYPKHWAGHFQRAKDCIFAKCSCCEPAVPKTDRQISGSVYSQFQHCCFLTIQISQNQIDNAMKDVLIIGKMIQ